MPSKPLLLARSALALAAATLLAACASPPEPSTALMNARQAVRQAESDPAVRAQAPLELKRATDSLQRANLIFERGDAEDAVANAAYVASQQAATAVAMAAAKTSEEALGAAQRDRETARADARTLEADRARAQTRDAQGEARSAQAQAANANMAASSARTQTEQAELRAAQAQVQTQNARSQAEQAQADRADLQQQLAALQGQQTDRGMLITLGDMLFANDSAVVRPAAGESMRKLAAFLQRNPGRQVLIEGHTDNVGTAAHNEALSLRRAKAVDEGLAELGISRMRLQAVGHGEAFPVADNANASNRALNRRVEIYVADGDQPVRARR